MSKQTRLLLWMGATALVLPGLASAHTLFLSATSTCSNNQAVINYTVTTDGFANNAVDIFIGLNKVDTVAVTGPGFSTSGSKPAPAGATTPVRAVTSLWADGQTFPYDISTLVTIATGCTPSTTGDGRFTGGGKQVLVAGTALDSADEVDQKGNHVTKGFEIHCDLDHPNNLEVNWGGGHHFHTEVFTDASCSDDPNIHQQPPKAPVDTIVGKGTGRYDGVQGYTIEFTLVDAGEPGKNDQSGFKIYETANPANIVLNVPLTFITGGNIQAHFDNK